MQALVIAQSCDLNICNIPSRDIFKTTKYYNSLIKGTHFGQEVLVGFRFNRQVSFKKQAFLKLIFDLKGKYDIFSSFLTS